LELNYLKSVDSTQTHLIEQLKKSQVKPPYLLYTYNQTNGIGSRENQWIGAEGNLFFSFALTQEMLPSDLKPQSYSIYFGYIIKQLLHNMGSKVILKWPNDIYLADQKIGGIITTIKSKNIICGVGINAVESELEYQSIDIAMDKEGFLLQLVEEFKNLPTWKQIFSNYRVEFEENKKYNFHDKDRVKSLADATLNNDGSITIDGEMVYSLR
jgi:BirA family biotin operon repressor/biotin-[acetyl-CoA-carboxylase] ligase